MVAYLLKMCLQRLLRTLVYLWGGGRAIYNLCHLCRLNAQIDYIFALSNKTREYE